MTRQPAPEGRQTRNTERTRQAVLEAAVQVILKNGSAVTLAQVASAAGVSKSGLIHHFNSRDQLVVDVVQYVQERFRQTVLGAVDLSENYPGKVLRAYVRVLCAGEQNSADDALAAPLWNSLHAIPAVAAAAAEHSAWWEEQFSSDGLSSGRILVVRRAAEGVAAAAAFGEEDEEGVATARRLLLELATDGTYSTPI